GAWSKPVLVKAGSGLIDPCPLWDDNGKVYLVHAYAGSRYGMKSLLAVCELSSDATKAVSEDVLVFDGHPANETCEGPKFHKQGGYYYIFFPAGGVKDGWQMAIRSRSVYGPYEAKKVMDQGASSINGPHQGAWVHTPFNEDWFFHFQEQKPLGRVVCLQPMSWNNGWPVIGVDKDGDGCGEPLLTYTKPKTKSPSPVANPAESDEFDSNTLGKQWQWYANPRPEWVYFHGEQGFIRLFSYNPVANYKNLLNTPNLLLQKFPAPDFTATTKIRFTPNQASNGERCGLAVIGMDYATLTLQKDENGFILAQISCKNADQGAAEIINESVNVGTNELYLRVTVRNIKDCTFSYSLDGQTFQQLGKPFTAREGLWIGAKVGLFCTRTVQKNDGGWMDVDWFRITK
ncbi:MAG: family 43 glycosylhydrolase, partial [Bacteroidota bacterium]|nr:family 43 glycosylhydrolase [Bacteroidota bacterium]